MLGRIIMLSPFTNIEMKDVLKIDKESILRGALHSEAYRYVMLKARNLEVGDPLFFTIRNRVKFGQNQALVSGTARQVISEFKGGYSEVFMCSFIKHENWQIEPKIHNTAAAWILARNASIENEDYTDPRTVIIEALRNRIEELEKCSRL